jgi:hypothetical protein
MLRRLCEQLTTAGVESRLVEAHGPVRVVLRAEGLEERIGSITRYQSLVEAVQQAEAASFSAAAGGK